MHARYSPMHRDAEDLLHCREDLGHFFRAPVSSMLRDDNGLLDFCNSSISIELTIRAIIGVTGTTKVDNSFSEKHVTLRSETTVQLLFQRYCTWKILCSSE